MEAHLARMDGRVDLVGKVGIEGIWLSELHRPVLARYFVYLALRIGIWDSSYI